MALPLHSCDDAQQTLQGEAKNEDDDNNDTFSFNTGMTTAKTSNVTEGHRQEVSAYVQEITVTRTDSVKDLSTTERVRTIPNTHKDSIRHKSCRCFPFHLIP
jgi:hypothetical protein